MDRDLGNEVFPQHFLPIKDASLNRVYVHHKKKKKGLPQLSKCGLRWNSQRVGGGYAHFFLFIFTSHLAALRKLRVGVSFVRDVSYVVDLHTHLNSEESPEKYFMKLLHKFSGDLVTHTGTVTLTSPFSKLCCQWLRVHPDRTEIFACVCGSKTHHIRSRTHKPPHLSLMLVRKYVSTPHQRRGVVVVVNEKALV